MNEAITEAEIRALVANVLGIAPLSATRQTFGHNSMTYDVELPKRHIIVRTNADPKVFAATERNLATLAGLGLPVPNVITSDPTRSRHPFAYMMLDKIPGRDLRYELAAMTPEQMTRLAEQIVGFQQRVMRLSQGSGFGYVGIGEAGRFASWPELVRHETYVAPAPENDERFTAWQARIERGYQTFADYLRAVAPTCFLDDVTVKNVIVENGELQGLIDFDCVCYGDPLFWLALTTVGVVSDVGTRELFYVEELKRFWGWTPEQETVWAWYSAAFALAFWHRFAEFETPAWRARMSDAVENWLAISA